MFYNELSGDWVNDSGDYWWKYLHATLVMDIKNLHFRWHCSRKGSRINSDKLQLQIVGLSTIQSAFHLDQMRALWHFAINHVWPAKPTQNWFRCTLPYGKAHLLFGSIDNGGFLLKQPDTCWNWAKCRNDVKLNWSRARGFLLWYSELLIRQFWQTSLLESISSPEWWTAHLNFVTSHACKQQIRMLAWNANSTL